MNLNPLSSSSDASLWLAFLCWSWGSWRVWRGAFLGARGHSIPRLFVGMCMTVMAVALALDLAGVLTPTTRGDVIRTTGILLALSLGFTANTGVKFGHKVRDAADHLEQLVEDRDDGSR